MADQREPRTGSPTTAVLGKDFHLYLNTVVPPDTTPTWAEYCNVKDVTRSSEKALADASSRCSSYRMQIGTLKEMTMEWSSVYSQGDTLLQLLQEAYDYDELIQVLDLDGPIDTIGSSGIMFMASVNKATLNEPLEDVATVDISLSVGYDSANLPTRVHVTTAGTVVPIPAPTTRGVERALPQPTQAE